ncbi:MAG: hypothetical protein UX04_C0007G0033 [Microgenomates group bacterium GW2011_GWF2_45_18]|nr:MAG: hypothetical protein UW18_C0002G0128 [Microgenomates group bacterium GW2011_GWF1_44_10]KKU01444.1 MAG: hypothetical protein UX04_C0007G0033 [Microgenomates group bacterium GW2011_GWF2_45_18]OGJ41518.1 MAG: hypothetical protein A2378_00550 [Candidatus Pacebacteria bacterium RIFOXYB1_FULL_44_10]HAX01201.1 hypothetical protein [Candidatus Paceibacterota bacterium]
MPQNIEDEQHGNILTQGVEFVGESGLAFLIFYAILVSIGQEQILYDWEGLCFSIAVAVLAGACIYSMIHEKPLSPRK